MKHRLAILFTCFAVAAVAASLKAQQGQGNLSPQDQADLQSSLNQITIPEGTEFKLQLHTSINSKTSKVGDRLIATLIQPVSVEDMTVLRKGTRVFGHVSEVKHARRHGKPGYLSLQFDSVEMPNGEKVAILGSLTEIFSSAESGSSNVGPEGDLKGAGASHKEQLAIFAGPTAAAAAAGLGPGIAVGVASGVAAILIPKGKQAVLMAGSLVGMRLDEDITLNLPPGAANKPSGAASNPSGAASNPSGDPKGSSHPAASRPSGPGR
jgi:hypothetical protein